MRERHTKGPCCPVTIRLYEPFKTRHRKWGPYLISEKAEVMQKRNYSYPLEIAPLNGGRLFVIIQDSLEDVFEQAWSMNVAEFFHFVWIIQVLSPLCIMCNQRLVKLVNKSAE